MRQKQFSFYYQNDLSCHRYIYLFYITRHLDETAEVGHITLLFILKLVETPHLDNVDYNSSHYCHSLPAFSPICKRRAGLVKVMETVVSTRSTNKNDPNESLSALVGWWAYLDHIHLNDINTLEGNVTRWIGGTCRQDW